MPGIDISLAEEAWTPLFPFASFALETGFLLDVVVVPATGAADESEGWMSRPVWIAVLSARIVDATCPAAGEEESPAGTAAEDGASKSCSAFGPSKLTAGMRALALAVELKVELEVSAEVELALRLGPAEADSGTSTIFETIFARPADRFNCQRPSFAAEGVESVCLALDVATADRMTSANGFLRSTIPDPVFADTGSVRLGDATFIG